MGRPVATGVFSRGRGQELLAVGLFGDVGMPVSKVYAVARGLLQRFPSGRNGAVQQRR